MKIRIPIPIALVFLHAALHAAGNPLVDYAGPVKSIPESAFNPGLVPISIVKLNPVQTPEDANTIGIADQKDLEIIFSPEIRWKIAIIGFQSFGKESWAASGTLTGNSSGYASIGYSHGTYALNVIDRSRKASFGMKPVGGGTYLTYLQLPDDKPFCTSKSSQRGNFFDQPEFGRFARPKKSAALAEDDSLIVDMAVYWTSDAADFLGGDEAVKAQINRNVLELNEALKRSGGKGLWRVGLAQRINQSGIEGAPGILEYAGRSSSPVFDSLVAETCLRGLDYTQIILVKGFPPDIAGINRSSLTFVAANAMGYDTPVHEAGHALGCAHERTDYPNMGEGRSEYAFGFDGLDSSGAVMRCLMYHREGSYKIPYFSNPTITVRGTKIGIPVGSVDALGQKNSADCSEKIRSEDGAKRLATYSGIGLTIGGYKKYGAILPGGVQEYWLKIGNISGTSLPIQEVGIHKDAGDTLISSDPPGTLLGKTYILWNNLGSVPPGEFLKPTFSEKIIRFKIKPGSGKSEIGELSYAIQNPGFFMNQELISPTPVDPNAGIAFQTGAGKGKRAGFQTGFSTSRFIDMKNFPNGAVIYKLNGSSSTMNQATKNSETVFPAFGWKAIRDVVK